MAGVTLDAGPLIALERRDRRMEAWVAEAATRSVVLVVPAPALAEVWRGGPRSALLARALTFCDVDAVDEVLARRAGELLAAAGGSATVDALVVASAARRGDLLLTADPDDMRPLAVAAGVRLAVL